MTSYKSDEVLGAVVFELQPKPLKEYISEIERSKWSYYFNPFIFVVMALFVFGFLTWLFKQTSPMINQTGWIMLFALFIASGIGVGMWWYYLKPKKDFLYVCEKGFKWRIQLCKWNHFPSKGTVLYKELKDISCRLDYAQPNFVSKNNASEQDKINFIVDLFFPKGDLGITFKDGKKRVLENIMKRFITEDIDRFVICVKNAL